MTEEQYIDDCIARLENAFIAQIDPSAVAAIVIETVQGEGGFIVSRPNSSSASAKSAPQHGIVYVADEVHAVRTPQVNSSG